MTSRSLLVSKRMALVLCCLWATLMGGGVRADTSVKELDAKVDASLARFREHVKGADEYLHAAKGVLVIPEVKKAGLVVGGQWGEGELRLNGKTVDYFKMEAGSAGLQAGYQEADYLFLFMTREALDKFRESEGWTGGAETGITVVDKSMGVSADTLKSSKPVTAFVVGKKGLMGGFSAKGTKFTRFTPKD